jgi:formylglycine-generating enzyme required for sulfatase activity
MWTCWICTKQNSDTDSICVVCHKSKSHSLIGIEEEIARLDFSAVITKLNRYIGLPVLLPLQRSQLLNEIQTYTNLQRDYERARSYLNKGRYADAIHLFEQVRFQITNSRAKSIIDFDIQKGQKAQKAFEAIKKRRLRRLARASFGVFLILMVLSLGVPYYQIKQQERSARQLVEKGNIDKAIEICRQLLERTAKEKYREIGLELIQLKEKREAAIQSLIPLMSRLLEEGKHEEALAAAAENLDIQKDARIHGLITTAREEIEARAVRSEAERLKAEVMALPGPLVEQSINHRVNREGALEVTIRPDLVLVRIRKNEFIMGAGSKKAMSLPSHRVALDEYWISRNEIMSRQFKGYMELTGTSVKATGISWDMADGFCEWLSKKTGLAFSLPTEAQWENAARMKADVAKKPGFDSLNAYGIEGMYDDLREWCFDFYDKSYYARSPLKNPKGPEKGDYHNAVVRGSSKRGPDKRPDITLRFKGSLSPDFKSDRIGFRVVMQ